MENLDVLLLRFSPNRRVAATTKSLNPSMCVDEYVET